MLQNLDALALIGVGKVPDAPGEELAYPPHALLLLAAVLALGLVSQLLQTVKLAAQRSSSAGSSSSSSNASQQPLSPTTTTTLAHLKFPVAAGMYLASLFQTLLLFLLRLATTDGRETPLQWPSTQLGA